MASIEKRIFQAVVTVGSLVPIGAGAAGILYGPALVGAQGPALGDLDSHFRYLSGLLLAIGLGYLSTVPAIETRGRRFALLTALVVFGGVGRLVSIASVGPPSPIMAAALVMELLVTPVLAAWQWRLARRLAR
jgi:hypothetical protein